MTKRQFQLLQFLIKYQSEHGWCASYSEMCDALGLHSKSGINRILASLQERGYVTWIPARARSVTVLRGIDSVAA